MESKDEKVFQKLAKGDVVYIDVNIGFEKPERLKKKLGISRNRNLIALDSNHHRTVAPLSIK